MEPFLNSYLSPLCFSIESVQAELQSSHPLQIDKQPSQPTLAQSTHPFTQAPHPDPIQLVQELQAVPNTMQPNKGQ